MRKKVWRKKFAAIAARDRQFTVKNVKKNIGIDNTNRQYCDWKLKKSPQPASSWLEVIDGKPTLIKSTSLHVDSKKMNHVEYMEKLTQHKLAKWERKNPKPLDMFTEEVEKWKQQRETAEERLRDFVVSIYDKLPLVGRFEQKKDGMATYQEKKIADLKDENGDGHRVNEISVDSKLVKKAQQVTNKVHAKHANLICTNLKDHKRQKGRIILPQAA